MKRGLKLFVALVTVLLLTLLSTTALADTLRFGTVKNSNSVNLRVGASKSTKKLGSYSKGTWLQINGESGEWYKVTGPDGKSGYMMKKYIYISAGAKGTIGIVDVKSSLTLHTSASASSKSIGSYPDGVPCILLSKKNDWYYVSVDGKKGYFSADNLKTKYMTYSPDVATVVNDSGKSVNLRKGPGKSYGAFKSIKNGSYAMILQKGNGWWKISVNGSVGYMDDDFLYDGIKRSSTNSNSETNSDSTSIGSQVVVNTNRLHLRASASKSSRSLGLFSRGTYVTVLEKGNTWCKVKVDGKTGYMMTEFLGFNGLTSGKTARVKHPDGFFVNLRSAPIVEDGNVLLRVPHGAKVDVLSKRGSNWSMVQYCGVTGYMLNHFLAY